jgi:hypothetical protein
VSQFEFTVDRLSETLVLLGSRPSEQEGLLNYGPLIGYLLYIVPLIFVIYFMWRSLKRNHKMVDLAADNTKAVEENTAAIRELIRKLDERNV